MKERPITLTLLAVAKLNGAAEAQSAIFEAVCNGELLPMEATALANIVEARRKAIEGEQLEARIATLGQERNESIEQAASKD